MSDAKHDWTPEMLVAFRELYSAKPELPFTEIARLMSETFGIELTRNACIGKAHRLGLPMRGHRTGPRKPHPPHVKRSKMIKVRIDAPIPPEPEPTPEGGLTIYQLRDGVCHWPGGGVQDRPPFLYCGEAAPLGMPYCADHTARAYSGWTKAHR
jgi:GcrA cell cycle regulator